MQLKSKNGKYTLFVGADLVDQRIITVASDDKSSEFHLDFDVRPAAFENFVADAIAELGLTKRIQKALKPLLADAAHAQGIHSQQ